MFITVLIIIACSMIPKNERAQSMSLRRTEISLQFGEGNQPQEDKN